jgi:hypothetical protein
MEEMERDISRWRRGSIFIDVNETGGAISCASCRSRDPATLLPMATRPKVDRGPEGGEHNEDRKQAVGL